MDIELTVDGHRYPVSIRGDESLLELLRDRLLLRETKEGCGEGRCGACTVDLDGRPAYACLVPAVNVVGSCVRTVASLADSEAGVALQQKFIEHGAVQCGFCTPGMLMAVVCHPDFPDGPADAQAAARAISGNLCRCTGYVSIIEAVVAAAQAGRARSGGTGNRPARSRR